MMIAISRPSSQWLASLALVLAVTCGLAEKARAADSRPTAVTVLPESTVAMVSIGNVPDTTKRFAESSLGRMLDDPKLSPLVGALYGSLVQAAAEAQMQENVGVSLPDLLGMFQGEVTLALVSPETGQLAPVLLVDLGEEIDKGRALLARLDAQLVSEGRSKDVTTIRDTDVVVYGGRGTSGDGVILFEKDNAVVVGTNPDVLGQMLFAWDGGNVPTIADNPSFGSVMRRCKRAADDTPQAIAYVDPIALLKTVSRDNTSLAMTMLLFPALGLDGLTAAGGSLTMGTEEFDLLVHGHIVLRTPRKGVIKAVAIQAGDSDPEPWVPANVASYMTLHWNAQQTYDEVAYIYDTLNGEGALAQLLDQRVFGPVGLQVVEDVLPAVEGRLTTLSWIEQPVTAQSQATMVGLKLNDTEIFDKLLKNLTARFGQFEQRRQSGKTYYAIGLGIPRRPDMPPQNVPQPCFGLIDDYLVLSSRESLYQEALKTLADKAETLADTEDFQTVMDYIRDQNGGEVPAMISFSRPEESFRFLYDLVQSDQTRQSLAQQALNGDRFFMTLQAALKENPLPKFEVLQQYLAPQGAMIIDEPSGLHYMQFTLHPPKPEE